MSWKLIDTGIASAEENMEIDRQLLEDLHPDDPPILHLYDWKQPSATCGCFIDPSKYLDITALRENNVHLARRPTGGGILFHLTDFAFSALVPSGHPGYSQNILKNYAYINNRIIQVIEELSENGVTPQLLASEDKLIDPVCQNFCMAKSTKYDVMIGGKKVGGAAQRRRKQGFLHQGTIACAPLSKVFLAKMLLPNSALMSAMDCEGHYLAASDLSTEGLTQLKDRLKGLLIRFFAKSGQKDFLR